LALNWSKIGRENNGEIALWNNNLQKIRGSLIMKHPYQNR